MNEVIGQQAVDEITFSVDIVVGRDDGKTDLRIAVGDFGKKSKKKRCKRVCFISKIK